MPSYLGIALMAYQADGHRPEGHECERTPSLQTLCDSQDDKMGHPKDGGDGGMWVGMG